ncbi:hypothetical protein FNV43_RR24215 [Rhamnella rubrinervis]|uniref:peptidylprolyl isomerase n=1 Tax=Rhamnella rubrinervis TaxID=2594499 RepID=A0A8K0DS03_9ROSA|nr:hypothetical protein FNV43_RR24215 [Rhamnella rubrinervis]
MGFWGIEVKPGKPYPYHSDNVRGKLHITQATLGLGSSTERCIVQCSIGHKNPIFLCSLLPNKNESCTLNLEFEDDDDLVAFSVIGNRSIHLSGYFVADEGDVIRDDYESDSFGEDVANTETDSSEYDTTDDESRDGFIVDGNDDDDLEMYSRPIQNSGVVIEEIEDDEEPKVLKRKNESSGSEDNAGSRQQIVVRGDTSVPILESEDEDGFPISTQHKGKSNLQKTEAEAEQTDNKTSEKTKMKKAPNSDTTTNLKRKIDNIEADGHLERPKEEKKKKKKKKQAKEEVEEENADEKKLKQVSSEMDKHDQMLSNEKSLETEMEPVLGESTVEKKKKKKKNKKKTQENVMGTDKGQTVRAGENQNRSTVELEQNQTESKSSKVRTFGNGLVIEELAMGKPDGKRASPGKQVSVRYIGKLQKNGKIFDSNVGGPPFKFRLGLGQVISGWDVGVNGMRVGDKRRLTIPPSMGYGAKGAGGGKIPPNAWLLFDVELVDVR